MSHSPLTLSLDRNPYLEASGSPSRVEFFPVALEFRPSRRLMSRFWQRLVPNREPSPPDRWNVIALGKDRASLCRNQTAQLRGNPGNHSDWKGNMIIPLDIHQGLIPSVPRHPVSSCQMPARLDFGINARSGPFAFPKVDRSFH
jgi:hypothetical protein